MGSKFYFLSTYKRLVCICAGFAFSSTHQLVLKKEEPAVRQIQQSNFFSPSFVANPTKEIQGRESAPG